MVYIELKALKWEYWKVSSRMSIIPFVFQRHGAGKQVLGAQRCPIRHGTSNLNKFYLFRMLQKRPVHLFGTSSDIGWLWPTLIHFHGIAACMKTQCCVRNYSWNHMIHFYKSQEGGPSILCSSINQLVNWIFLLKSRVCVYFIVYD